MKKELLQALESIYGPSVTLKSSSSTGGGCINHTQVLHLSNGERVFLKSNDRPPADLFSTEATGLDLLGQAANGPLIPKPLALDPCPHPRFLLLEYIEETDPGNGYYSHFAEAMASLHRVTHSHYGLDHDNYIGSTVQKNTQETDGLVFFRDHRLRFQQELARKSGKLPARVDQQLDRLCDKLRDLLDLTGEQPALLHGDLWSGNHFPGTGGRPCIFDPAVYFGPREADLAMTELFGRMPQTFYDSYHEAFPLNPGYDDRKKVYNLYHLLNHLNLFGGSYLGSVEQTVRYFTD